MGLDGSHRDEEGSGEPTTRADGSRRPGGPVQCGAGRAARSSARPIPALPAGAGPWRPSGGRRVVGLEHQCAPRGDESVPWPARRGGRHLLDEAASRRGVAGQRAGSGQLEPVLGDEPGLPSRVLVDEDPEDLRPRLRVSGDEVQRHAALEVPPRRPVSNRRGTERPTVGEVPPGGRQLTAIRVDLGQEAGRVGLEVDDP